MSWLSSFIHPGRAYEKAGKESERYYNQGQQFLQPYNQHGEEAYGNLSGAMQNLMHPQDFYNELMQNYETSPYAQNQQAQSTQHALNAASSMGMLGSTPALNAMQAGNSAIGNADRENYFKRLMDMYFHGADISQNIYGQGAQAGNQMGQNAINQGTNASEMAFGQNAVGGQMFGNILGNVSGAGMMLGANKWMPEISPWKTSGNNKSSGNSEALMSMLKALL
jgi:hypothetical protein